MVTNNSMADQLKQSFMCSRCGIEISGQTNLSQHCQWFTTASTFIQVAVLLWCYIVEYLFWKNQLNLHFEFLH